MRRHPSTVAVAAVATVIASQALISGAFSLAARSMRLGHLPHLRLVHTSDEEGGQVYVPAVNWALMAGSVMLVIWFGSSARLAAAYGVAVVLTMLLTTILFFVAARDHLGWPRWRAAAVCTGFLVVDLLFVVANLDKVPSGGWFPLLVAAVLWFAMATWVAGRRAAGRRAPDRDEAIATYVARWDAVGTPRVPGTTVYLASGLDVVPPTLVANRERNHVLHDCIVVATLTTTRQARIAPADRLRVVDRAPGLCLVEVRYGFVDVPDVPAALAGLDGLDVDQATYVVGGDDVVAADGGGLAPWRERVFAAMHLNASSPASHYRLPPGQVIHLGRYVPV